MYFCGPTARATTAIGTIGSIPANGEHLFTELHWLLEQPLQKVELSQTAPKIWSFDGKHLILKYPWPQCLREGTISSDSNAQHRQAVQSEDDEGVQPHELRLLPQPLYRYQASTQEQDGAIFAFVWTDGTDPDGLLLHIYISGSKERQSGTGSRYVLPGEHSSCSIRRNRFGHPRNLLLETTPARPAPTSRR